MCQPTGLVFSWGYSMTKKKKKNGEATVDISQEKFTI